MAKNIVRLDENSHKVYELDNLDAEDLLGACQSKAACLATLAPKLHDDVDYGGSDNPVVQGFASLLQDLADDLEVVSKTFRDNRKSSIARIA